MSTVKETALDLALPSRAFEATFSLIRALGTTLEVEKVSRLSLLTVTGQLLVRKAAFYLKRENEGPFSLCGLVGLRKHALADSVVLPSRAMDTALEERGGVAPVQPSWGLPEAVSNHFQWAAYLRDGDSIVGLLLLGGRLQDTKFSEADEHLLQTMGLVIGTTLQKALVYEQMLYAKLKMEEAERLRKAILDHVSHEFNTPLMVVKSTAELARTAPPEQLDELYGMHNEATERLDSLVRAVLQMASQVNEPVAEFSEMSLDAFIAQVVKPVLYQRDLEGIRIVEGHQGDPHVSISVDPTKIKLSMDGLVLNSSQFNRPEAPWVAVHCYATSREWWTTHDHLARIDMYREVLYRSPDHHMQPLFAIGDEPPVGPHDPEDAFVVLEVVDAGIGIPQRDHDRIFEPFTQASNSPTSGVRGAGLGLASCRNIIQSHGGDVLLRSEEDRGSVFAIMLPATWNTRSH